VKQASGHRYTAWIRTSYWHGRLGLNDEARAIFLAMINTGARPSELAALTKSASG
jgi:hypothetical protein